MLHLQCNLGELFFGEVQRVIEGCNAKFMWVLPWGQVGTQYAIVHHIEESSNTMPAFVIEPDLKKKVDVKSFILLINSKKNFSLLNVSYTDLRNK